MVSFSESRYVQQMSQVKSINKTYFFLYHPGLSFIPKCTPNWRSLWSMGTKVFPLNYGVFHMSAYSIHDLQSLVSLYLKVLLTLYVVMYPCILDTHSTYFVLVIFSGLFAVTFSVIFAYVADVTDEHERTWAYGAVRRSFSSCFTSIG